MTACASPEVSTSLEQGGTPSSAAVNENEWAAVAGCVITVDGSYAARLARSGDSWFPERWTLDGPEPYAVPLPGNQPEEPGTEVLPMADGRVLIHRLVDGRHTFSLLYPTGPGTGEVLLGAVECPDVGTELRLLPPAPAGTRAYALAVGRGSTAVWLVAGGAFGPEHLAEVPGRCSGGVWLGGSDRLLALDRELDGRTKTVVVDLERGGEVSPLLQISERSNDRLLLADADSGLLLIRSDAPDSRPGTARLGRVGEHAAGALPGVPATAGPHGHSVRDPAGAGTDAGELRGRPADRRPLGQLARRVASRRAVSPSTARAQWLVGGLGPMDQGRGAPSAVRDGDGAVRRVTGGSTHGDGGRGPGGSGPYG